MTQEQLLKFLKAPLNFNCFIAYLFIIPFLFIAPFVDDILRAIPIKDNTVIIELLKTPNFFAACLGCFLGLLLISGFRLSLANNIIKNEEPVFDISVPYISNGSIIRGLLCSIGWGCCCVVCALMCIFLIVSVLLGVGFITQFLASPFNVIVWLVVVPTVFVMTVLTVLNLFISYLRFLKTLKVYSCFSFVENYRYVKQYKGRVFLACLILFVLSQIISVLTGKIGMAIIQVAHPYYNTDGLFFGIRMAICMLVFCICGVYIGLLHTMIVAKTVTWIEQKPTSQS